MLDLLLESEPLFTCWNWLWEDWESDVPSDGAQNSPDPSIALTIEQMLRSSIPTERLEHMRTLWKSLPHSRVKIRDEYTMRWNLGVRMKDLKYDSEYDPTDFLKEISSSSEDGSDNNTAVVGVEPTEALKQQAKLFLHELMLTTLATLWNVNVNWSAYMNNLPPQVNRFFRCYAIEMTSIVIMCELS